MFESGLILQNRYQLIQPLRSSPQARQTWMAIDLDSDSRDLVVVKLLVFAQMQWQDFELFEREAQVLQYLNHERIPQYRDYFRLESDANSASCVWGLVQTYAPGVSLQEQLEQGKRFTEREIYRIAEQVLEILVYLHGLCPPLLHRDIKPSNLLLDLEQQVWLVDFGAVQNQAATTPGSSFTVVGTVGYAPLEQFWGKAVAASDLYALGATLIQLLTGIAPADLPQRDLRLQFRTLTAVDRRFIEWVEKLTEPAVERRFGSADEAYTALSTAIRSEPSSPVADKSPQPTTAKSVRSARSPTLLQQSFGITGYLDPYWFFTLLGMGMLGYGSFNYQEAATFEYRAVGTIGTIGNTRSQTTCASTGVSGCIPRTTYTSTVRFKTRQGNSLEFTVNDACHVDRHPYACDGTAIKVFYEPGNPKVAMIQGGYSPLDRVKTWIGWGAFFVLVGMIIIWGLVTTPEKSRS